MTIHRLVLASLFAAALRPAAAAGCAAGEAETPPQEPWSFAGPFGKFDRGQLQRGFKVYREVCQVCHGLTLWRSAISRSRAARASRRRRPPPSPPNTRCPASPTTRAR